MLRRKAHLKCDLSPFREIHSYFKQFYNLPTTLHSLFPPTERKNKIFVKQTALFITFS